jgi:hypothetical protein
VRVDNRGPFDDEPTIHLYWAYPGTFLGPASWKPIGEQQVEVPGTNSEGTKVITPPFLWEVPAGVTRPALIAVANSTLDAVPALTSMSTARDYIRFLHRYNNLAHRNILTAPRTRAALWQFSFMVPAIGASYKTQIRVVPRQYPAGTKLIIGLPRSSGNVLRGNVNLGGLRAVDRNDLMQEAQGISGSSLNVVERALANPVGEWRQPPGQPPETWLYGDAKEVIFPNVSTIAGKEEPLLVGAYVPTGQDPSGLRIDVVQELAGARVGQINLRVA